MFGILVEEDEIKNQNEDGEELLGNVENINGIDGFATREALIARIFHCVIVSNEM